jgi:hypothetical protein
VYAQCYSHLRGELEHIVPSASLLDV